MVTAERYYELVIIEERFKKNYFMVMLPLMIMVWNICCIQYIFLAFPSLIFYIEKDSKIPQLEPPTDNELEDDELNDVDMAAPFRIGDSEDIIVKSQRPRGKKPKKRRHIEQSLNINFSDSSNENRPPSQPLEKPKKKLQLDQINLKNAGPWMNANFKNIKEALKYMNEMASNANQSSQNPNIVVSNKPYMRKKPKKKDNLIPGLRERSKAKGRGYPVPDEGTNLVDPVFFIGGNRILKQCPTYTRMVKSNVSFKDLKTNKRFYKIIKYYKEHLLGISGDRELGIETSYFDPKEVK